MTDDEAGEAGEDPVPDDPARDFAIARDLVPDVLDELGVDGESAAGEQAIDYARRYDMHQAVAGRSPSGVAAGMVYLATNLQPDHVYTRQEVADAADVNVRTVTKNWRIIADLEDFEYSTKYEPAAPDWNRGVLTRLREVFGL